MTLSLFIRKVCERNYNKDSGLIGVCRVLSSASVLARMETRLADETRRFASPCRSKSQDASYRIVAPRGGVNIGEIIASDHNMAAFAQGKDGCSSHLPDSGRLPATFDDPGGSPDRRLPFGGGTD